jgi:DNA-binding XRE family transcriptional regulator
MSNFNSVLNERISRIARKQIKAETGKSRRLTTQHRRDIAALKRQVAELQKAVGFLQKQEKRRVVQQPILVKEVEGVRFRADGLRSHRKRLGLSAEDYGKLVGAAGLSIYNWEAGKSRPRSEFVAKLVAVRRMGKREVQKRLELLNGNKGR